jgi:hypothetical protein
VNIRPQAEEQVNIKLTREIDVASIPVGKTFIEAGISGALAGSLDGDMSTRCSDPCVAGVAGGGRLSIGAGYRVFSGFELGLSLGYVGLRQVLRNRHVGTFGGGVNDTLSLHGLAIGLRAGYTTKSRFPLGIRLFGDIVPSWVGDQRTDAENEYGLASNALIPAYQSVSALFGDFGVEAFTGVRIDRRLEVLAGFEGYLLFTLKQAVWDGRHEVGAGSSIFTFPAETMVGPVVTVGGVKISARYTFD